jgi:hypothetical protein
VFVGGQFRQRRESGTSHLRLVHDVPAVQYEDPVGVPAGQGEVVAGHQQRPRLRDEFGQRGFGDLRVQRGGGLVGEQHRRPVRGGGHDVGSLQPSRLDYACGMGMYTGYLTIV